MPSPATKISVHHATTSFGSPLTTVELTEGQRRNALDLATVEALIDALVRDPAATVVLASATPGIFCAGADLDVSDAERTRLSDRLYECYGAMVSRPGLVIAAVDGPAVGGGAQLCAAADLRVASTRARWRWLGPGHGLAVGAWILPRLLGRSRGLDLTLTGRWLPATEARDAGFVRELDDDPRGAAEALAAACGRSAPEALARVKRIATDGGLLQALDEERRRNREDWDGRAPAVDPGAVG